MDFLWSRADQPKAVLILAHGAGAAMDSEFMETMAGLICETGITVVRFEFPYMQERRVTGKKRPPDRQPKLLDCWQQVLAAVREESALPVFIGGKSMGGRMASLLAATGEETAGVVCLGYPFYATGKKDKPRVEHLENIATPVLILQGERDAMGDRETVSTYSLAETVKIEWLPDGNHDLKPRKVSGFNHQGHLEMAARAIDLFIARRC